MAEAMTFQPSPPSSPLLLQKRWKKADWDLISYGQQQVLGGKKK
jgi:hypothetical protein